MPLALLILALAAAPGPGETVAVKREGVRLMKGPRFFGPACGASVRAGDRVKVVERRGGWARIAAPGAGGCWVHETAWSDRKAGELTQGGGQASARDVELAGRGFSEDEERRYRAEHRDLDAAFRAVEEHVATGGETPAEELSRFRAEGKLQAAGEVTP